MPYCGRSPLSLRLRSLLAIVLLVAASGLATAQTIPGLPSLGRDADTPAAAETTVEDWVARLEAARAEHRLLMAQPEGSMPLLSSQQMASARRLLLLTGRIEALRTSGAAADEAAQGSASPVKALAGPAPYSVLEVDGLRDQLERLSTEQAALNEALKSMDGAIESAIRNRGEAEANLRLVRERASRAGRGDDADLRRARVALANLQAEVAALEVIQSDDARRRARERVAALAGPIDQLRAEIRRANTRLRLDEADLQEVLAGIAAERRRLDAESARLTARLARHEADAVGGNASRGREVQALTDAVQALREFEELARGQESLWRSRREMLAPDVDLGQRRAQATTWNGLLEALGKRLRRLSDEIRLSRSGLRAQQALVANQPADDPARAAEQQTLEAFQLRLDLQERLHEGLEGTVVLVTRARSDLGFDVGPSGTRGWLEYLVATAGDGFGSVWNYELFSATETLHLDGRPVTVEHGVTIGKSIGMLVLFAVGYWAAGTLSRRLIQLMSWRLQLSAQLARVLRRWLNAILVLVVLLVVLKLARIPITAFAFLGGALAIGVGFGAQNVIKNLISGIIILFERKIHVGDIVDIGGMVGTVVTVDLRATTVRGFDGIDAIVPNSMLLENQISNWSGGSPEMRRTIIVGVAYGSDLRRAARVIADCAGAHPSVLQLPVPEVLFNDFANDNLSFKLQYWMRLGGPHGGPAIDSDLRFAIAEGLQGAGIVIAFPQRDVHLDAAAPLRVQIVGGSPPSAG